MVQLVLRAILFVSLLGQSFANSQAVPGLSLLADMQHAAMHWQDEGHHHHDDGSYHLDDSTDSAGHLLADHATPASIVAGSSPAWAPLAGAVLHPHEARAGPQPDLDGLLRPPRLNT